MLYPDIFPEERADEHAERKVFQALKTVADRYDIFYARRFVSDGIDKRAEYEIDFLIFDPGRACVCLEVKGGQLRFSGIENAWYQNSRKLSKGPDQQAQSAAHSLVHSHKALRDIPVGWAVCFPDVSSSGTGGAPSLREEQIIDEQKLTYLPQSLESLFALIKQQHPNKNGARRREYHDFKALILRNLGFAKRLGSRFIQEDKRFVQLTERQLGFFKRVTGNQNILVNGPAGSGKTILGLTLAQEFAEKGKKVLFLCYNRTLANKIRYEFPRSMQESVEVATFHSLAKRHIDKWDPDWWGNANTTTDGFWSLEAPAKLDDCIDPNSAPYDVLIIDEGQDFKEFWFEIIFKLCRPDGRKFVFLDPNQDIFSHFSSLPSANSFFKYELLENCRNTRSIVAELNTLVDQHIQCFENAPVGEPVIKAVFSSKKDQFAFLEQEIKSLTTKHSIDPRDILFLLDETKAHTCLNEITTICGHPLTYLDQKARRHNTSIAITTIDRFKGLECAVVFYLQHKASNRNKVYTIISRATHLAYQVKCE